MSMIATLFIIDYFNYFLYCIIIHLYTYHPDVLGFVMSSVSKTKIIYFQLIVFDIHLYILYLCPILLG